MTAVSFFFRRNQARIQPSVQCSHEVLCKQMTSPHFNSSPGYCFSCAISRSEFRHVIPELIMKSLEKHREAQLVAATATAKAKATATARATAPSSSISSNSNRNSPKRISSQSGRQPVWQGYFLNIFTNVKIFLEILILSNIFDIFKYF